jgi:hypothetical protein
MSDTNQTGETLDQTATKKTWAAPQISEIPMRGVGQEEGASPVPFIPS